jgi:hypothetical protein
MSDEPLTANGVVEQRSGILNSELPVLAHYVLAYLREFRNFLIVVLCPNGYKAAFSHRR